MFKISRNSQIIQNQFWVFTKYRFVVISGFIIIAFVCGVYLVTASVVPVKGEWVKQQSNVWFNWTKPCHYYRFRSTEKASVISQWFVDKFREIGSWRQDILTESLDLADVLRSKLPENSDETLNKHVMEWSRPVLGGNFAIMSNQPFFLLVHSNSKSPKSTRVVHIRVFDMLDEGSIIEIWENRTN